MPVRGVACVPAQGLVCLQHGLDESSPYAASFRACHPSGRTEGRRPSVFLLHPPRLEVRGLKSRASNGGHSPPLYIGDGSRMVDDVADRAHPREARSRVVAGVATLRYK